MRDAGEGGATEGLWGPRWGTEGDDGGAEPMAFSVSGVGEPLPDRPEEASLKGVPVPAVAPDGERRARRRRLRPATVTVAGLVIVAAAVGGILATSGGGSPAPGAGMSPAAFVVSSTQNTVAQKTADMVVSGSLKGNGVTIPVSGSGQADFSTNQVSATVDLETGQHSVEERELVNDGQFFMSVTVDGQNLAGLTGGGAQWIQVPVPQQSASAVGGADVNPLNGIRMAEQHGAKVVPLGSSTIDGDTVSGYSVTPSLAEIEGALQQEVQSGQITASDVTGALHAAAALGTFDVDVWIDGNNLLRRESVNVGGGTSGVTGDIVMTFQNYGTPVDLQAPDPSSVESFTQFENDMKALQPSSS